MSESIKVASTTLSDLLSQNLAIPEYQRPYIWTKREIEKLLLQLSEHHNRKVVEGEKPNFYLGSIVLHNDGEKMNIIDGQQRLTTMQILDIVKNKKNYQIKYSHPVTFKNIQNNYKEFVSKDFHLIDYDSINVTIVETNSEDMAYNFFETLNTGGKRLGGTDVLKAHHLRCINDNNERNSKAFNWEKRQKNLERVNRMLSIIRRLDYLHRHSIIPDKFTDDGRWKNILTEDFAEKTHKNGLDIGYSFVEIEENTHKITADKYSIRQPLNEGINYINYLLSFTNDYNSLFIIDEGRNDKYAQFQRKIINEIDGTVDLRFYYQLLLMCFVDRFGKKNILEFSLYLFRIIYSLRLNDKARIYEATVRNFVDETKMMDRILNAFTYEEILKYLKEFDAEVFTEDISGVKQRYFDRVNNFFNESITKENFDKDLIRAIEQYK